MVYNTGNRLVRAIVSQIGKIRYFCAAENLSANVAVHELRKSFKRLRALLRFYNELTESPVPKFRREIRNLGKLLSPLRESAVNLELFNREFSQNTLIPEKKIKSTREKLIINNKTGIDKGYFDNNLCNVICSFFYRFENVIVSEQKKPQKKDVFNEVNRSYLKSYEFYKNLPKEKEPEELHSLRKILKKLWYQMDFIRFIHPRYFKVKVNQLNKITEQLGNDHDLYVFWGELTKKNYNLDNEELLIFTNQVNYLREINLIKLEPRIENFFIDTPDEFKEKLTYFFKI